jgi:hypothetical protein
VRLSFCRDDFYLFIDTSHTVRTFESARLTTKAIPPPDKSSYGVPIAFDLSPSHNTAAVAYSDGGVEIFALDSDNPRRLFSKPTTVPALSLAFRDDTSFLFAQRGDLWMFKISWAFVVKLTVREAEVAKFPSPITAVTVPPVFRFQAGAKPPFRCGAPKFCDAVAVCTSTGFTFGFLGQEFATSFEVAGDNATCAFSLVGPDELRVAVSVKGKVLLYSVTPEPSVLCELTLDILAIHTAFVNSAIVVVLDRQLKGYLVSQDSGFKAPVNCLVAGEFIAGDDKFFIVHDGFVWRVMLQTFRDKMGISRAAGDFAASLDLCKRAMANDPEASVGLPSNPGQRALMIEQTLSDILVTEANRRLDDRAADAAMVVDWLIGLNRELGMEDWIVNEGVGIFRDRDMLPTFFQRIIHADPEATAFSYTANFGSLLLETPRDFDIRTFVLKLPKKIVSEEAVLNYGIAANDHLLLSDFYVNRLGDLVSGLTVLANGHRFDEVCSLLLARPRDMECSIRWLFLFCDGEFTILKNIVALERSGELFDAVERFIETHDTPFSYERYINFMIRVLANSSVPYDHPLWIGVEDKILRRKIAVVTDGLKCLLRRVFSPEFGTVDRREELLQFVLSGDVSPEVKEGLLPLCETYGFKAAKRLIQQDSQEYDRTIRELAADLTADVIDFMVNILDCHPTASPAIVNAVVRNASVLIARGIGSLVEFVAKYFSDSLLEIIEAISPEMYRNMFVYELLKQPGLEGLKLAPEVSSSYFAFLCEYFPSEARFYIEHREERFHEFLNPSEEFQVFDCCVLVYNRLSDFERVCQFFGHYIETQLVCYAEDTLKVHVGTVGSFVVGFSREFLRKRISSDEAGQFAETIIKSFSLPLYALDCHHCRAEKVGPVVEIFRNVSSVVIHALSFARYLELVVVECQELPFGFVRSSILMVLSDYEYDLDQKLSIMLLYHEDEANTNAKYISDIIRGTKFGSLNCDTCGYALFGASCTVKPFGCGHVFHETTECLPKEVCPKCNPVERLDQNRGAPIKVIPSRKVRRDLTTFELLLARGNDGHFGANPAAKHLIQGKVRMTETATFPS